MIENLECVRHRLLNEECFLFRTEISDRFLTNDTFLDIEAVCVRLQCDDFTVGRFANFQKAILVDADDGHFLLPFIDEDHFVSANGERARMNASGLSLGSCLLLMHPVAFVELIEIVRRQNSLKDIRLG